MLLHDFPAHREPQTHAAGTLADLHERLEHARAISVRDTFAAVADFDFDRLRASHRIQRDAATAWRVADRVADQVVQYALDRADVDRG
jgi:hypothetical protein